MRRAWRVGREMAGAVGDFLYPEWCGGCGGRLEGERRGVFCLSCWNSVQRLAPPWCVQCGIPYSGLREGERCGRCAIGETSPVDYWRCGGAYEGVWREAIQVLKFQRRWRTRRAVIQWWMDSLRQPEVWEGFADVEWWVAVPMHALRAHEREGNHVDALVKAVAKAYGRPVWHGLRRVVATKPQSELSRTERRVNVRRAFEATPAADLQGRTVGLVDDIVTTGATVEACARALRRAGAARVKVAALARTL